MNSHIKLLILNWNGSELTNQCLASVEKLSYNNYSTMVIDNGSSDDTIAKIHKNYPSVEVLALDKNYGFSPAYNLAFEHLQSSQSDYYLIINNDTTVEPNLLEKLMEGVAKFGAEHLYCPIIHYVDNPNKIWYAGGNVDLKVGQLTHVGIRQENKGQYSELSKTGYVTGCCIFISPETIHKLNGFDEGFNMYAEDVDLCLRGKAMGIDSIFVPDAKIYHKVSASVGGESSFIKLKRKLKSVKHLMSKHCSPAQVWVGFSLYLLRNSFLGIFHSISSLKK